MARTNGNAQTKDSSQGVVMRQPHDLDAERQVLGAMLLDNACIPEVIEIVKAVDFYSTGHQAAFQAIVDLYNQHQTVDLTMLADELRRCESIDDAGGVAGLAMLEQNVLATGAAPDHARMVSNKATYRRLMRACEHVLRNCAEEASDIESTLDTAEQLIYDVGQQSRSASFVHIGQLMASAVEEIGELHANKGEIPGISSGFVELDRYLNGFSRSDLVILAARPSIGKTAFALNLALNVSQIEKVGVGVFSLEMGKEQLNMRLLCTHARISSSRVRRGMLKESEFTKLRERASDLQNLPIFIDDSPSLSLMQVRARARRLASQEQNLGMIIVDYLQLMSGPERPGRDQNRQQEVSEISRGLKALARELNVPVIALSQLSRNIEQRSGRDKTARPQLSDLRESGAIEQDADVVLFVHRERKEVEKKDDGTPAEFNRPIETDIIIGKHRNGPTGTAHLLFWPDFTQFTDLAVE